MRNCAFSLSNISRRERTATPYKYCHERATPFLKRHTVENNRLDLIHSVSHRFVPAYVARDASPAPSYSRANAPAPAPALAAASPDMEEEPEWDDSESITWDGHPEKRWFVDSCCVAVAAESGPQSDGKLKCFRFQTGKCDFANCK